MYQPKILAVGAQN